MYKEMAIAIKMMEKYTVLENARMGAELRRIANQQRDPKLAESLREIARAHEAACLIEAKSAWFAIGENPAAKGLYSIRKS